MAELNPRRHVYFSVTTDNPFLPDWYIQSLEEDMDPKLARRMIYGEWVEITTDVIYHQYSRDNYRDYSYEVDPLKPIFVSFDFNIGEGKPMSACLSQYHEKADSLHYFAEVIVEGADTEEQCAEIAARGHLDYDDTLYIINGDATGDSKSSKSKKSDYDIINKFFANYRNRYGSKLLFQKRVPKSNPPVRTRHNLVNAYCRNALGKTRLFVYKDCKILDKGMRLTTLKKGGQYIEDDSKPYQHVTTALGYNVCYIHKSKTQTTAVRNKKVL